ncbi:MAG: ATP-binding cassette domain-containing protein [Deltaproteobacteria bacterium]|nr:ATP-binding cassette domain-containing protein [Deltaproteobacteria bacterium]
MFSSVFAWLCARQLTEEWIDVTIYELAVAQSLSRSYATDSIEVKALREVSFDTEPGSFVALVGPSGSGKRTLLNLIGCLDRPTSGNLEVAGLDVHRTAVRAPIRPGRKPIRELLRAQEERLRNWHVLQELAALR